MLEKLKSMWNSFLDKLKLSKGAFRNKNNGDTKLYEDVSSINLLAVAVNKLSNLSCNDATFEIESQSNSVEPLKSLVKDLELHRFDIVRSMLGDGDYYVFPAFDKNGNITHSFLTSDRVRIVSCDGEKITEAYAVLDYIQPYKNSSKTYFLQRHHKLENGTLTISYDVVNENGITTHRDEWAELQDIVMQFRNAEHIGFGRYKSPQSSRGISPVYGVPLNFGCADIEKKIVDTLEQIEKEFKNAQSKIFVDPRNLVKKKDQNEYVMKDNIFPVKHNSGDKSTQIEIFNPAIRSSEHFAKLQSYLELYEQQIGVNKGILTDNSSTATATATAVKRSNSDTVAMLNLIHNALDMGNKMTLEADSVYMGILLDLWEYHSDYIDPFSDVEAQWKLLKEAKEQGAAETNDLIKWNFPDLTDEQVEEKKKRIMNETSDSAKNAVERALSF